MNRIVFAAAALILPAAAGAQTAPAPAASPTAGAAPKVGATVYDTSGGVVGTVASMDGGNAVIDTGTIKAAVPTTSLGKGTRGPVIAMTKAQLEAAAGAQRAQSTAAFQAQLQPGSTVYGTGGATLGTIKSVSGDNVVLTTPSGEAAVPATGFGPGPKGVTLGMTAEQLKAALGGAGAPGGTAASTTTTTSTTTQDTATGTSMTTGQSTTAATPDTTTMPAANPTPTATPTPEATPTATTTTTTKKTRRTTRPQ